MSDLQLSLEWISDRYAVCRLAPHDVVPEWATRPSAFSSVTRTDAELSLVVAAAHVPEDVTAEGPFAALRVRGVLDFSLTGILATLTTALADAGIPVFAISTFDSDVLLVRDEHRDAAARALGRVARFADGS